MRSFLASALGLAAFTTLAACATADPQTDDGEAVATATASQPIINGSADTSTPAAVFVYGDGYGCTGSLFKVDRERDLAWVLTAAHCVLKKSADGRTYTPSLPQGIFVATDYEADPNAMFIEAVRSEFDERYLSDDRYDVGVITLHGIPSDAALPPLLQLAGETDGLRAGQTVTSYGFGTTNIAGTDANSTRRTVSMTISQLDPIDIVYNQSAKGICSGDSGGPVVADNKVVGIHSRVQGQSEETICNGTAYSVRVSSILPFVDGVVSADQSSPPTPVAACERCTRNADYGDTVCRQKRDLCTGKTDCRALFTCLTAAGSSSSKQTACMTKYPDAQGLLLDYLACSCNDLCATECSSSSSCSGWRDQKCGSIPLGDAESCVEANCCAEVDAAAIDPRAASCLTGAATTNCESNAAYAAASACLKSKCDIETLGPSSGASSSSGGEPTDEEPGDDDGSSGTSKKSNKDEGGCAVTTPGSLGSTGGALTAFVFGLGLLGARRRSARR